MSWKPIWWVDVKCEGIRPAAPHKIIGRKLRVLIEAHTLEEACEHACRYAEDFGSLPTDVLWKSFTWIGAANKSFPCFEIDRGVKQ